jgi:hypothetical protein
MTLDQLKAMLADGSFDHATYRNHGTLWEGLWIYGRSETGFRGYSVVGAFYKGSPDLDAAFEAVRGTGISVGAYGHG